MWKPKKVEPTRVRTPLASEKTAAAAAKDTCVRAENEDDDGYDPYSDRQESTPLFEENPWE